LGSSIDQQPKSDEKITGKFQKGNLLDADPFLYHGNDLVSGPKYA
jgi:hypothetical protein